MRPQSSHHLVDSNIPLLMLPTELSIKIYYLLPSFSDVFALAATCQQLRRIWTQNVHTIYSQVAPRSISCERYARFFFVDQGGPAVESPMHSASDVVRMEQNSRVIAQAIDQFEREIIPNIKGMCCVKSHDRKYHSNQSTAAGFPMMEIYGTAKHPPNVTNSERLRFIRAYYQLWGMMNLEPAQWASRLESMKLKQLYYLCEMSKLTQSIGNEEKLPAPEARPIGRGRSKKRNSLEAKIWDHIESIYQRTYREKSDYPWIYAKHEGSLWFVVIWDHWQGSLKQIVCGGPKPSTAKSYL